MKDEEITSEETQRPEVLPYGQPKRGFALSRRQRMGFVVGGVGLTVLVIADRTIDRISCGECCTLSGVNSGVRYIDVSNKRFERERFIRQGPLSRFLEQADGQACRHVWTFSSGSWRSLFGLGGVRAQGLGGSFGWADSRFHGDYPIEEVLELEKEKDSGFVKRLRHAIRNPEEDSSEHFFDWLFETLEAYEEAHPDWGEARKAREWRREEPKAWCEAVGKAGGTIFGVSGVGFGRFW